MSRLANHKRDKYFLRLVTKGVLKVYKNGTVKNTKTGTIFGTNKNFEYQLVSFYDKNTKRVRKCKIHRLILLVFKGPIPDGYEPNHKDGIKHNNRLSNLELVTYSENVQHAYDFELKKRMVGESNGLSKLTEYDIKEIFKLRKQLWSMRQIAVKFNVTYGNIKQILNGSTWKHVKGRPSRTLKVPHRKSGIDNGRALLTEKDVLRIRNKLSLKYSSRQIARHYNMSKSGVESIIARRTWKHI